MSHVNCQLIKTQLVQLRVIARNRHNKYQYEPKEKCATIFHWETEFECKLNWEQHTICAVLISNVLHICDIFHFLKWIWHWLTPQGLYNQEKSAAGSISYRKWKLKFQHPKRASKFLYKFRSKFTMWLAALPNGLAFHQKEWIIQLVSSQLDAITLENLHSLNELTTFVIWSYFTAIDRGEGK